MPAVVTAVEALTSALNQALDNSKVMTTLDKEITKSLGLLVDLILLPFLPLLVGGIVQLYQSIVGFGNDWAKIWKTIDEKGLVGLIKLAFDANTNAIAGLAKGILTYLFGTEEEKKKQQVELDLLAEMLIGRILGMLPWLQILTHIFGKEQNEKIVKTTLDIIAGIIAAAGWSINLIGAILDFLFSTGTIKTGNDTVDLIIDLIKGANPLGFLWDLVKGMFTGNWSGMKDRIELIFDLKKGVVDPIVDTALKTGGGILDFIGGLFRADGGPVSSGRPYIVGERGPELFIPSSNGNVIPNGSGGNVTLNFYGYQDDVFIRKVRDVLRQDGSRYSL